MVSNVTWHLNIGTLDEDSAIVDWVQGPEGKKRGVHPDRVAGGEIALEVI